MAEDIQFPSGRYFYAVRPRDRIIQFPIYQPGDGPDDTTGYYPDPIGYDPIVTGTEPDLPPGFPSRCVYWEDPDTQTPFEITSGPPPARGVWVVVVTSEPAGTLLTGQEFHDVTRFVNDEGKYPGWIGDVGIG